MDHYETLTVLSWDETLSAWALLDMILLPNGSSTIVHEAIWALLDIKKKANDCKTVIVVTSITTESAKTDLS